MWNKTSLLAAAAITLAIVGGLGCSSDDHHRIGDGAESQAPVILGTQPADGAVGVQTTATVGIKFDMPMDTMSVSTAFHLFGGEEMHAWMDSLGHHRGMMPGHMRDMEHMMAWADTMRYHGQWHWNEYMDSCYFVPEMPLLPSTDHAVYLPGEIRSARGMHMATEEWEYGGPMIRFRTGP